ncbi:prepilin peptidase [Trichloromonas sp.]|uniref:prepilin peptidase n=1 Tax=Trichloromonas sp. TaxID=3069249 RepID=UPI003D812CF6
MSKNIFRLITGLSSMTISILFFCQNWPNPAVAVTAVFLTLICLIDTIKAKIPNITTLSFAIVGLGLNWFNTGANGLFFAAMGLVLGLLLFLIPYLMGGMGAGDVKALAALGALLGPGAIFQVFLYTSLIGGVLSILHYLFDPNLSERLTTWRAAIFAFLATKERQAFQPVATGEKLKFPYASAIAFGYCAFLNWGAIF